MTQPATPRAAAAKKYGFPRTARLVRTADYRKVYAAGRRRNLDLLMAFALPNGKPHSRIGLSVPAALGGAVQRNRLKRRLREAARRHLAELGPGWDIVFGPRAAAKTVTFERLERVVSEFFRACARSRERSPAAE